MLDRRRCLCRCDCFFLGSNFLGASRLALVAPPHSGLAQHDPGGGGRYYVEKTIRSREVFI